MHQSTSVLSSTYDLLFARPKRANILLSRAMFARVYRNIRPYLSTYIATSGSICRLYGEAWPYFLSYMAECGDIWLFILSYMAIYKIYHGLIWHFRTGCNITFTGYKYSIKDVFVLFCFVWDRPNHPEVDGLMFLRTSVVKESLWTEARFNYTQRKPQVSICYTCVLTKYRTRYWEHCLINKKKQFSSKSLTVSKQRAPDIWWS